ncbi:Uncharacterised protein [Escherichia coli]|uniref:Uncharacterized protein n=1 Tax=Escherichia phage vB_Eco_slurp01 TaxID=1874688 RepID=A0A1C3S7C5_9CAUD|nr:hypothetical protein [Escherichia coli]MED6536427.1 hypothetical protein [Escherichia coli O157]SCA80410.1 hypothetical protein PSLUR01_00433 [Escherichia phage vB_Eco_slurp01]EHV4442761.1 hypothetical protein [Escherichia coli]MDI0694759.1 hypothetical protein [Escherichia coli]MED6970823.1 hypothetical protein [Escherichia coli O157]
MNYSWMEIVKSLISTHDMDLPEHLVINRWYYPYPDNRCVGIGFFINEKSQYIGLIEDYTKTNIAFSIELNVDHIKYYTNKMDEEDGDVIIPAEIDEASFFQLSLIHDVSDITYDNVKDLFILYNKLYNYFL